METAEPTRRRRGGCGRHPEWELVIGVRTQTSKPHPTIQLYVDESDRQRVFHAVADPTRRRILDELAKRDDQTLYELCVRMLTDHGLDMTRQGIEKHLAILEEAGLVGSERRGKYRVLRLDAGPLLRDVEPWVRRLTGSGSER